MMNDVQRAQASMPSINHWNVIGFREHLTRKKLREILLFHENIMCRGHLLHAKTKHLGAGIYQLWYEQEKN